MRKREKHLHNHNSKYFDLKNSILSSPLHIQMQRLERTNEYNITSVQRCRGKKYKIKRAFSFELFGMMWIVGWAQFMLYV